MAEKHDEFKVHLLSFTDEELDTIICALYDVGEDELADEIDSFISYDCECYGQDSEYDGWMADKVNEALQSDKPTISHKDAMDGFRSNIATLTIDVDVSKSQSQVDNLLYSLRDACDKFDQLRGFR